jgi:uncharacterized protein (TIGR03067 family)
MRITLFAVTAGLLLGADAKEDVAKNELKKFAGTWMLVSGEKDGKKVADEDVKKSTITWKGAEVALETPHLSKEPIKSSITLLDPSKKPHAMSWKRLAGPDVGKEMHAIYEFLGDDEYRICFAPAGKDRPNEFSAKTGSGHFLHVWKRVKE